MTKSLMKLSGKHNLTRSERENTERITYTHASVCDVVRELKTEEGKDIWLLGGTSLVGQLQRENLIDEYHTTCTVR